MSLNLPIKQALYYYDFLIKKKKDLHNRKISYIISYVIL